MTDNAPMPSQIWARIYQNRGFNFVWHSENNPIFGDETAYVRRDMHLSALAEIERLSNLLTQADATLNNIERVAESSRVWGGVNGYSYTGLSTVKQEKILLLISEYKRDPQSNRQA